MEQPEFPEWAYICNGVKRFTTWEAVQLISWNNPYSDICPDKDDLAFIDAITASILQAIEDADLIPTGKKGRGDQDTFDREELRAWAKSVGYGWPLPPLPSPQSTPAPAADSVLLEKVQQLEAQNAALVQQVAALERQLEQASATPEERRWPWGRHTTPELEILREVAPMFWTDGKLQEEKYIPTNEEFSGELIEHGLAKHKANALASMFRPDDMPMGRRPNV